MTATGGQHVPSLSPTTGSDCCSLRLFVRWPSDSFRRHGQVQRAGVGGAARYAAAHYAVHVTGIDLTPEYRGAAEKLSAAVGLAEQMEFVTGSALDLPFDDQCFDAAYTIHAAMNIQNKEELYRQAQRVLRPGGDFLFMAPKGETGRPGFALKRLLGFTAAYGCLYWALQEVPAANALSFHFFLTELGSRS